MGFQESVEVRNAKLDAACACLGTGSVLRIFSDDQPENCAAEDPEGLLVEINLPHPCMGKADDGTQEISGTWSGEAIAEGTAASFRFCSANGSCCRQGSISDAAGDGNMKLENININVGQTVTVSSFTITAGNA